jgi:hypothetical protein
MVHEKTIPQSRDRQGADPLADARGSVRTPIFGTVVEFAGCLLQVRPKKSLHSKYLIPIQSHWKLA